MCSHLVPGDTAWLLAASGLVAMMTIPGLALFYGGLVRGRNVLSIMMLCFVAYAVVFIIWVLYGYSLAFSHTVGYFIGDLAKALISPLVGITPNTLVSTVPEFIYCGSQLIFAVQ